ncbi:hypothetical protein VM1G_04300 [Cytospora mali]|uniref:Heat shock 70 kDa protein 12A n=1 Tax=Cytospora mali TaxID=578113 RepID=A0A194VXQ2_CYTMA|nr:hypothetical protein VM1G_04300 [Valsa mali]
MAPPRGAIEEVEKFDNYNNPSEHIPKSSGTFGRKRLAGPIRHLPAAKKPKVAKKKHSKAPKAKRVKPATIVAGIDFGTTFTGFTYAYSGDAGKLQTITDWVDGNGDDPKTPSAIRLAGRETQWGIQAKETPEALRWFKLLLVNRADLPVDVQGSNQVKEAREKLRDLGKTAVSLIATYLKLLWSHCLDRMKVAEGEETVVTSRFHVVITLPAIWPNYARDRMRQAVEKAGIMKPPGLGVGKTTLDFVSEPEAAALATLSGVDGHHNIQASFPQVSAPLDCGGGTVDLISYKVAKSNPMELMEVLFYLSGRSHADGKLIGSLCGAIFVDERFKNLIMAKLKLIRNDALDLVADHEITEIMDRHWENGIRKRFIGAGHEWNIRYPYSLIDPAQMGNARSYPTFTITSQEVEDVFRPIVEKIQALVIDQINAVSEKEGSFPKYIILVGGFGRSKYLHEYLKKHCLGLEVLQRQGFEPWSAISRGAVIHGLTQLKIESPWASQIKSRIARASYGVVCQENWDDEKHEEEDRFLDEDTGELKAVRQMKWSIRSGEDIEKGNLPRHELYKHLDKLPESLTTDIYMSKALDPPTRRDESVMLYCKVTWDMNIDWESLEVYRNIQGKEFRRLDYAVEMKCSGGSSVFYILHNGRRQAAKNVSVEVCENSDI